MKILLSAYACEPNKGSEPGVGWNWAKEIANRGHTVWVITRSNNRECIETAFYDREKIQFIFYDLPLPILRLKKIIGVNFYYILWQMGSAIQGRKWHSKIRFDLVHHITFGVFRNISYLPFLIARPFVFGPVGGGETTPNVLKKSFGSKNNRKEFLRETLNKLTFYNPVYRHFISACAVILCKTKDTLNFVPKKFHFKTSVELEIGVDYITDPKIDSSNELQTNIIFVGRFIYWKGAHLCIRAFNEIQRTMPNTRLIMIGKGEEIQNLKRLEAKYNIKNIEWIDWVNQTELQGYYNRSSLMLFPSLHDSSGNVVLEALSNGVPVVCLDLGGPSEIIGSAMDTIVSTKHRNEEEVIKQLSIKVCDILSDQQRLMKLRKEALIRASELTWKSTVHNVYSSIEAKF